MAPPSAELSHLPKADGSANFSFGGYTITAAVNGPVEAQRRDENPFEALVDVNVRPAAGVGGEWTSFLFLLSRGLQTVQDWESTLLQDRSV